MMAAAIHERVVAKPKNSFVRDLAVALERMGSGSLMKRQPEFPVATIAVGQVAVSRREQRAASDEIGIDELEIEPPPVRIAAVLERNLRGGSQKVALDKSHLPRLVAAHTGEARLRLRAPTVGGDRADDELAVDGRTHGIDTHGSEYAECPQCALALLHPRAIERIAAVHQETPANDPLSRADMQRVRHMGHPVRSVAGAVEHVLVFDDDGVDRRRSGIALSG